MAHSLAGMTAQELSNVSDEELINRLNREDKLSNVPIAELTRRNTKEIKDNTSAIKDFNSKSSLLSKAMIFLAIVSIIVSIVSICLNIYFTRSTILKSTSISFKRVL